jgi:hypothetical protein
MILTSILNTTTRLPAGSRFYAESFYAHELYNRPCSIPVIFPVMGAILNTVAHVLDLIVRVMAVAWILFTTSDLRERLAEKERELATLCQSARSLVEQARTSAQEVANLLGSLSAADTEVIVGLAQELRQAEGQLATVTGEEKALIDQLRELGQQLGQAHGRQEASTQNIEGGRS